MDHNDDLLVFMHIPKTAGTTLRKIIEKQYDKNQIYRPKQDTLESRHRPELKCIFGHAYFGEHHDVDRNLQYITMLRDPVERVISEYYYLVAAPNHDRYIGNKIKNNNLSLEDYVTSKDQRFCWRTENMQTRFAAGGKVDLKKAKENFRKHFLVVGLTERFEESLALMKERLGWQEVGFEKKMVSKNRKRKRDILPRVIKQIEAKNKLDRELYQWAKLRFEQELKKIKQGKR